MGPLLKCYSSSPGFCLIFVFAFLYFFHIVFAVSTSTGTGRWLTKLRGAPAVVRIPRLTLGFYDTSVQPSHAFPLSLPSFKPLLLLSSKKGAPQLSERLCQVRHKRCTTSLQGIGTSVLCRVLPVRACPTRFLSQQASSVPKESAASRTRPTPCTQNGTKH